LVGNARRYLDECLTTNFVSSVGPFVERFEREFAAYVGRSHAVACASGTAALHVAMRLLGVGPGDEVFVPSFTFVASANPVIYQGASVTLVDSEPETWNADPALIIDEIEHRVRTGRRLPRAVEIVHILGHPAAIDSITRICEQHDIPVIEDAAEALGARYAAGPLAGKHVGTIGTLGCFSFNGNKIITTGGGGMLVTDNTELARRARHLTTQARLPGRAYRHDEIGYNYRLTNLAAALGVAQLEQLPAFLARKRKISVGYDEALRTCAGIRLAPRAAWAEPSLWLYSAQLDPAIAPVSRDRLVDRLDAQGIEARPVWTPLHELPMYRDAPRLGDGTVASRIASTAFSLPSSVGLGEPEQQRVIDALLGAWAKRA
jgi:dTDP-4-amino-4,6-dideoxygalactose transaminase